MLRDNQIFKHGRGRKLRFPNQPGYIVSVKDMDEFNAPIHADIIRQVTGGGVAYTGLGSEWRDPEPEDRRHCGNPRVTAPVPPEDDIQNAFRRAWSVLHPDPHPLDVDTHRLARDEELKAAFAEAYRKLKGK